MISSGIRTRLYSILLFALILVPTVFGAVKKFDVEFTDDPTFLPLNVKPLHSVSESRATMQVRMPTHVFHASRDSTDSALIVRGHNADLRQDQPATFSFYNYTRSTIIDDHPIWLTIRDVILYDDVNTGQRTIAASGYRSDSAFVVKADPTTDRHELLFLTTGRDQTGNGSWNPGIVHLATVDYDYDGHTELFLQINSARDLLPRELFCIDLESFTVEWSLPVAPLIVPSCFHLCGDSTDPQIIFSSYNPKQNVTAGEFSDLYSYLTVVDRAGNIRFNKIISLIYGGTAVIPADKPNQFMVAHSVPFLNPDSIEDISEPVHTVSLIDLTGDIIASAECEEQVHSMWSHRGENGEYFLYVLSSNGSLRIYDSELTLVAQSDETVLRGMLGSLSIFADEHEVWLMATKYGHAIYDHSLNQMAFFEANGSRVSPLEYTSDGTLISFLMASSDQSVAMSIRKKNISDYLRFAFWRYKSIIITGMFILLIGLIVANQMRRRSQRTLRGTEAQLHAFFESSTDLAFVLNRAGTFLEFVAGPEKDLLVPPASFIQKQISEVLPPDVARELQACLDRAVITQKMATHNYSLTIDGIEYYYEVRMVAMSPDRILAVVRNQSEQVAAEKNLAESESRLRVLFDGARDAILLAESETGKVVEMNKMAVELFDRPRDKIIGSHLSDLCSVDVLRKKDDSVRQVKPTDVYDLINCEIKKSDNTLIPVELSSEIIVIDGQKMILSFVRDISSQVNADRLRIQSEGLQREQYKNIPIATYTWRFVKDDFILVAYNDVADAFVHGQMDRYLNATANQMYKDRPQIISDLYKCFEDGVTIRRDVVYDYDIINEERYLLVTYARVSPDLVTVYTEDVTEKKLAELALKENEEKLRAQYKGIPVPTYTWQKQEDSFVLVDYNDAAEEITKGGIKDIIGKKLFEVHLPDSDVARDVQRCHNTQEMIQCEMDYHFQSTDLYRLLTVRYVPVPPDLVMVHTEDITERKQAEQELKRSEERFRTLAESSLQGIFLLQDGVVKYINSRFAEILGRSRDELTGLSVIDFIDFDHSGERERLHDNYRKRLQGETAPGHYELKIERPDGTERWVEILIDSIQLGDSEAIQGVAIDITERLVAELKVHQAEQDRYNQIRAIAGGVSHEIYNALYPAMVALDKLSQRHRQDVPTEENRKVKLLRMSSAAVQRAIDLTEQVTQYSKLEVSRENKVVKLLPLIDEIIQNLSSRITKLNVKCSIDVGESDELLCLPSHAFSMLNNLIINALDAMEDQGQGLLSIVVQSHDDSLQIEVSDTGCGIRSEALPRLFDPFYSTKPKTGTGLGLAVVKRIVSLYDGSITVDSQLDRGTKFNILLPVRNS